MSDQTEKDTKILVIEGNHNNVKSGNEFDVIFVKGNWNNYESTTATSTRFSEIFQDKKVLIGITLATTTSAFLFTFILTSNPVFAQEIAKEVGKEMILLLTKRSFDFFLNSSLINL